MIINAQFTKLDSARFVSHIDLLRTIIKTIRRADLPAAFSQGFNPHMLVNLSSPLALGVASCAEYMSVTLRTPIAADEFAARFNACAPLGIRIVSAVAAEQSMGYAASLNYAKYQVPCANAQEVCDMLLAKMNTSFVISYTHKQELQKKDVADKIKAVAAHGDTLVVMLSAGNAPLRPDRFFVALATEYGAKLDYSKVLRTAQYDKNFKEARLEPAT